MRRWASPARRSGTRSGKPPNSASPSNRCGGAAIACRMVPCGSTRSGVEKLLGARAKRFRIEVAEQVESTNTALLDRAAVLPPGSVLAAEMQSGGRGRRGRAWTTGLGGALTFSVLWRFETGAAGLTGLSLVVGIAVARALAGLGATEVKLKWPNDVLFRGRKLGGILIEVQGDALGPATAVIGIGLNVRMPPAWRDRIDQPIADAVEAGPDTTAIACWRQCWRNSPSGSTPSRARASHRSSRNSAAGMRCRTPKSW